jgi:WXG100 family type VII secretion target
MPAISLDPDQADQTASVFSSSRGGIEGELSTMMNSANAVMSTWQGSNRDQFESQWQECQNHIRNMMEELERFSQGLRREAEEFRQADQAFG